MNTGIQLEPQMHADERRWGVLTRIPRMNTDSRRTGFQPVSLTSLGANEQKDRLEACPTAKLSAFIRVHLRLENVPLDQRRLASISGSTTEVPHDT